MSEVEARLAQLEAEVRRIRELVGPDLRPRVPHYVRRYQQDGQPVYVSWEALERGMFPELSEKPPAKWADLK